jgi:hypothetical protein
MRLCVGHPGFSTKRFPMRFARIIIDDDRFVVIVKHDIRGIQVIVNQSHGMQSINPSLEFLDKSLSIEGSVRILKMV